ncbi:MAG: aspartate aminotransferase family protein [Desulfobacterota bacterium]|nr:aspartate aminotransferase family protein [Thermodesulfobacteriota bacterium]
MKRTVAITDANIFQTYRRYPIVLTRGKGIRVWDDRGKEYLDFLSGIAVCNLGHCHPRIVKAIRNQARELLHVSNFFYTKPQAELAQLLIKHSFADRIFFCNSGAEANEAALKLARKYAHEHFGGRRYEIITMKYSFHGRTIATLTATGQEKFHQGFSPLLPGFKYVPFNDIAALERTITEKTCAIMFEPIQGEGGVNLPDPGYLPAVRKLCDQHGLLLIFDEVQVGMGRTGRLFAYEHYGIAPDIMTLAKALGGGLPAGAMLASSKAAKSFTPGSHASTFGGNPVAMAAGVAVMRELLETDVLEHCRSMGSYFVERLEGLRKKYPHLVREVRGKGLIIGMELTIEGRDIVSQCLEKGIIINCTIDRVLRFLPPLNVPKNAVDRCIEVLDDILRTTQPPTPTRRTKPLR